jgi:hypothetical protein
LVIVNTSPITFAVGLSVIKTSIRWPTNCFSMPNRVGLSLSMVSNTALNVQWKVAASWARVGNETSSVIAKGVSRKSRDMLIAVANGEGYHTSQLYSRLAGSDSRAPSNTTAPMPYHSAMVAFGALAVARACRSIAERLSIRVTGALRFRIGLPSASHDNWRRSIPRLRRRASSLATTSFLSIRSRGNAMVP